MINSKLRRSLLKWGLPSDVVDALDEHDVEITPIMTFSPEIDRQWRRHDDKVPGEHPKMAGYVVTIPVIDWRHCVYFGKDVT